jgi:hypothetical protein
VVLPSLARRDIGNALYHNLPEQAYFKSHRGELLAHAGTKLKDLDRPEQCPALLKTDVMLSAFGMLYFTLKRGNQGQQPLPNVQQAIVRHVVPLLATQPAYCTLPADAPPPHPQPAQLHSRNTSPQTTFGLM